MRERGGERSTERERESHAYYIKQLEKKRRKIFASIKPKTYMSSHTDSDMIMQFQTSVSI